MIPPASDDGTTASGTGIHPTSAVSVHQASAVGAGTFQMAPIGVGNGTATGTGVGVSAGVGVSLGGGVAEEVAPEKSLGTSRVPLTHENSISDPVADLMNNYRIRWAWGQIFLFLVKKCVLKSHNINRHRNISISYCYYNFMYVQ